MDTDVTQTPEHDRMPVDETYTSVCPKCGNTCRVQIATFHPEVRGRYTDCAHCGYFRIE